MKKYWVGIFAVLWNEPTLGLKQYPDSGLAKKKKNYAAPNTQKKV